MLELLGSISLASRTLNAFTFARIPAPLDISEIVMTASFIAPLPRLPQFYRPFPPSNTSLLSSASNLETRISPKSTGHLLPISFPIGILLSSIQTFTSVPWKQEMRSLLMKLPLCYLATKTSWVLCKQVLSPFLGKSTATSMLIGYSATLKIRRFTGFYTISRFIRFPLNMPYHVNDMSRCTVQ